MYQPRTYRKQFNTDRFIPFIVNHRETDLWIGVDQDSYRPEMKNFVFKKISGLWKKFERYFETTPDFKNSLEPFPVSDKDQNEIKDLSKAGEYAGIGPMSAIAGLFAREAAYELINNFPVNELVIENGGDIYFLLKEKLMLSVYAGDSPLSEKIAVHVPPEQTPLGICTSAGTVGHSKSFGKADAVMVACKNILNADALATALGNKVKTKQHVEEVLKFSEKYYDILSLVIICEDKLGIRGNFEVKFVK